MLQQLYIKDFTIIDQLDITFQRGFSVVTGETGAGKSIILGALGLLRGNRADPKSIKSGSDKCIVEAHFDIRDYRLESFFKANDIDNDDPADCILRREISVSGKSRAFINDQPVSLSAMRELGDTLFDIHSQHQNLLLGKEDFQLSVIDIIANDTTLLDQYRQKYSTYQHECQTLERMKADIKQAQANEEYIRFQYNELKEVNLVEGEQDELEQELHTLEHVEDIKSALYEADSLLSGDEQNAILNIRKTASHLHDIEKVFPEVSDLAERLDSAYIELQDIAGDITSKLSIVDFDPKRLQIITERLDHIYSLERKYHVDTIDELLALQVKLEQQLSHIDNSSEQLAEQQAIVNRCSNECTALATKLRTVRNKAATKVEEEMKQLLVPLGIPSVVFKVMLSDKPLSRDGFDKVAFYFSANKSTPAQPISNVASGGEIARVMLSLKAIISTSVKQPTIIFDEIDTGVSGRIAEKMAQMMQEMGAHERQVISITHLPQIAAKGTFHYKVSKEETPVGTVSTMRQLTPVERIEEIAQMLSGSCVSQAAIENAKSLMQ